LSIFSVRFEETLADIIPVFSFADRAKDTLKVSGVQVSPVEIESVILSHPSGFISDVVVAGVAGFGRTEDERVPRAWVVLSYSGQEELHRLKREGKDAEKELMNIVKEYVKERLSRVKWLRGGVEIVYEVKHRIKRSLLAWLVTYCLLVV
jgi:acyl-CoA synthetase (AMP-forming)/AMP-acid ligase II